MAATKKHRLSAEERKLARALNRNTRVLESVEQDLEQVEREIEDKGRRLLSSTRYLHSFFQGVLYGLGVLAAAAIVIPIVLALLKNVQWVPIVGDAVTNVLKRVEQSRNPGGAADGQ